MRMYWTWATLHLALVGLLLHPLLSAAYEVVYAVNCGGGKHTDRFGIRYSADENNVGIASDFGKSLIISRVHPDDVILYQTERYHTSTFSYNVPIEDDGDYALITKFAEVYFQYPHQKVFDVFLNEHHILADLDIFSKVGKAAAYDEVVKFTIKDETLYVGTETSRFDGTLKVEFAKGEADNPKVNAIVVVRGSVDNGEIPALPAPREEPTDLPDHDRAEPDSEWGESKDEHKFTRTSGPRVHDPYSSDDSWFMPITVAIAVFLPVLFCLCRVR